MFKFLQRLFGVAPKGAGPVLALDSHPPVALYSLGGIEDSVSREIRAPYEGVAITQELVDQARVEALAARTAFIDMMADYEAMDSPMEASGIYAQTMHEMMAIADASELLADELAKLLASAA